MNCDPLARSYRWMEYAVFGTTLQRCRCCHLQGLQNPRSALVLGDGDGRFTARLAERYPDLRIDYLDISGNMIALARRRIERANAASMQRIRFHQGDARTAALRSESYDVIAAHFFFDFFSFADVELMISRMSALAAPGAAWIVSDFELPPNRLSALWARPLLRTMYLFFRFSVGLDNQRLSDWRAPLRAHGFSSRNACRLWAGFIVSELWIRGTE
jgi:ubiquinone/menaquinone biosynthesis C-methylase UbiE